jgi:hypothetical protein
MPNKCQVGERYNRFATILRVLDVSPLYTTCLNERTGRTVVLRAGHIERNFLKVA